MLKISCVAAILENSNDKVLLQLHNYKSSLSFASHWTLPGGKVEEQETPDEAICRELMEEIELALPLELWNVYERPHSDSIKIEQYIYLGQTDRSISSLKINEGIDLQFFGCNEIADIPLAFGFDSLLKGFFEDSP